MSTFLLYIQDEIISREEWVEFVRPYYPSGKRGRPVKGIETMLRMYLLQTWFNLSDEGAENAVDWERYIDYRKSAVRCKVEHAFKIIKDTFGFRKVRYRGIAKNFNKLNVLFACANLLMVKRVQKDFCPTKG